MSFCFWPSVSAQIRSFGTRALSAQIRSFGTRSLSTSATFHGPNLLQRNAHNRETQINDFSFPNEGNFAAAAQDRDYKVLKAALERFLFKASANFALEISTTEVTMQSELPSTLVRRKSWRFLLRSARCWHIRCPGNRGLFWGLQLLAYARSRSIVLEMIIKFQVLSEKPRG